MNLIYDDINEITRTVMRTLMYRKINHRVHVARDGTVATRRADAVRGALPNDTLLGTYNHRITHAELRDDLMTRLQELSMGRIAA